LLVRKPGFNDPISVKELFIHAKVYITLELLSKAFEDF
jgi:hypothetical protein